MKLLMTGLFITLIAACGGGGGGGGEGGIGGSVTIYTQDGEAQQVATGSFVVLNASDTAEKNKNELTYTWVLVKAPDGSNAELAGINVVNPNFIPDVSGEYEFKLVISAGNGSDPVEQTIKVVAEAGNVTPMASVQTSALEARSNSKVKLDGSESHDANDDELNFTWSIVGAPDGSTYSLSDPNAEKPELDVDVTGEYQIQLVVNDGEKNSAPKIITVTVVEGNPRPISVAGYDIHAKSGNTVTLDGSLSRDADDETLTYEWFFASRPSGSNVSITNPSSVNPTFVPDVVGAYVISLRVNDGITRTDATNKRTSDIDNVLVIVTQGNNAPIAAIAGPDDVVDTGKKVKLNGASSNDPDGDTLTYLWSLSAKPDGSTVELTNVDVSKLEFTPDVDGEYKIQLVVNDGTVTSEADEITIVAETPNRAPVANAGQDMSTIVGTTINLDGSNSSDPDGDALLFAWSITESPDGSTAALQDADQQTASITPDLAGSYKIQLIVNDGALDSESVEITITVAIPNTVPIAKAGPDQIVKINELVTLNGSESVDDDKDQITYAWSFVSAIDTNSQNINTDDLLQNLAADNPSPNFTPVVAGLYILQLIVNDGKIDSDPNTVEITVEPVPAPVVQITSPADGAVIDFPQTITFTGSADDPNEGTLTGSALVWSDSNNSNLCTGVTCDIDLVSGANEIFFTATNSQNSSATTSVTVTVNYLPIASAGEDQDNVPVNTEVQLDGSGSVDNDATGNLTYTWRFISAKDNADTDINTTDLLSDTGIVNPTFTPTLAGVYMLGLVVNDTKVDSTEDMVSIEVVTTDGPTITFVDSLEKGLVAYYPFDGDANDASGNGNDGVVNGATLAEDRDGNADSAYQFDGVDDSTLVPHNSNLNFADTIGLSIWINPNNPDSDYNHIIDKSNEWAISLINRELHVALVNVIPGDWWNTGVVLPEATGTRWYNISIVYDSSLGSDQLKIYVDGLFRSAFSTNSGLQIANTENPLGIGSQGIDISKSLFNGLIDDIRVFSRVITEFDIKKLIENNSTLIPSPQDKISLCVNVTDEKDGILKGSSIQWMSDLDGSIGEGECSYAKLSAGDHVISVIATDNDGNETTETMDLHINSLPEVSITNPEHKSEFASGSIIDFQGSASDAEDSDLTGNALVWNSSIDGDFGTGESISTTLSDGRHTIMLTATDSDGGIASKSVTVCIPSCGVYSDDFESYTETDWGRWSADSMWQIGTPTSGPEGCYSGDKCTATVLAGNYPDTNGYLTSPSINLPTIDENEEIHLRFWHWFSFALRTGSCCGADHDYGRVYIQEQTAPGVWSSSIQLASYVGTSGGVWTKPLVDLSAYADKKVRLLFGLINGKTAGIDAGWYIDDITIDVVVEENSVPYLEDFETGLENWWTSNGSWQVGEQPTAGPAECFNESSTCAGTVLDGNYHNTNSNLVSPSITLPTITESEEIQLRFWQWFSFALRTGSCCGANHDYGRVYIQEQTEPGVWSGSTQLTSYVGTSGGVWTKPMVDLSAYAGKKVRLLFSLVNGSTAGVSSGWYIDDITIDVIASENTVPFNVDFEAGLENWWSSNGAWQVGEQPTAGPAECYNESSTCAGTVLDGNYHNINSNLVSPSITLPTITESEEIQLRFWQWFSFELRTGSCCGADHDYGRVYIQEQTAPGEWSGSTQLSSYVGTSGGVWTKPMVDLSAYAGKKVRLLFGLVNGSTAGVSSGWYIDNLTIEIVEYENTIPYSENFESGIGNWWSTNGTWQIGVQPAVGPTECYNTSDTCAGTVLDGNYHNINSSLVSPSITLPSINDGDEIELAFRHWFSLALRTGSCCGADHDYGRIYIQEQTAPGEWSGSTLLDTFSNTSGGIWARPLVDLTAFADKKIRLLFSLVNGSTAGVSSGWYIDDLSIQIFTP